MNPGPVFIGGLSFSGKTQLRQALSSHPNLVITRKTYMWTRFYGRYGDLSRPENFDRCLAAMLAHKPMGALHPDPERIRREFWTGQPTYARLFALFHEHYAQRVGKPRWGDQLGFIERYADPIFLAYPTARMIHMLRDPRCRLEESLAASSRRRKGKVGWETAQWLRSARLAVRNRQRYPDRYKVVRCEQFFSEPEGTLGDICSFLGEEYSSVMLMKEAAPEPEIPEGGKETGANEPLDGSGHQNGTNHFRITRGERAFIQTCASNEMAFFGYLPEAVALSIKDLPAYLLVDWPLNLAGLASWQILGERPRITP